MVDACYCTNRCGFLIRLPSNAFMEVAPYNFLALTQYSLRIFQLPVEPFLKKACSNQLRNISDRDVIFAIATIPSTVPHPGKRIFPGLLK